MIACCRRNLPLLAAACSIALFTAPALAQNKVIFDTDAMTDVDDLGALAVLHALADRGETQILATIISSKHPYAAPAVQVVNNYYGRPATPIGALHNAGVLLTSNYQAETLSKQFLSDPITLSSQRPEAVRTYREILASSPDKVTIMTVGYATNLRDLLASGPDEFSPLTGAQLVAQKVDKWVNMGGNFEVRSSPYQMNTTNVNWERDASAAVTAINNWPTEIVFAGREIGHSLRAGAALQTTPADNPVRVGYELYFGGTARDHHCADLATVLYAVRGLGHGDDKYWELETGQITMQANAKFTWDTAATTTRGEARLVDALTRPDAGLMSLVGVQTVLSNLMIAAPRGRDLTPPTAPAAPQAAIDPHIGGRVSLNWNPGSESDFASWVAGYNVYRQGQLVGSAFGTRFFDLVGTAGDYDYEIRTVNASGIESTAAATLSLTLGAGAGTGDGLNAQYFSSTNFTNPVLSRTDARIAFDWGTGSPDPAVPADSFSVRWTGFIEAAHVTGEQEYTFFVRSNDGARLLINGIELFSDLVNGPERTNTGTITLAAGERYPITLEYYENTNTALVELAWQTSYLSREVVPQQRLYTVIPEPVALAPLGLAGSLLLARFRRQ